MLEEKQYVVSISIFDHQIDDFNFIPFCKVDEYVRAEDRISEFYRYLIHRLELEENTDIRDFKFDFSELKEFVSPQYLNFNEVHNIFTFFDLNK